ncbi:3-ketoacyl-CoA thiolase [Sinobacterium norvegicum]|uniref:3-ketoacyl-CoA thiolase n=1 Tax=Sinobacterium norvegicum TaxID=1641715 RepID=A0ABM9AD11_9GAMM|nr:hypothetical protein [Sinobacterium norvegicum]CAH0991087.1 3-ketoacyl-CoA thiolase [Sinobacterium norvegicum]
MANSIADNNPIIVSAAAIKQKIDDPRLAKNASQLMADCCRAAAAKLDCPALLTECDEISVPQGLWAYQNPAGLIKEAIGSSRASTVFAKIGVLQQGLFNRASQRIQNGEIDIAIVAGGEAKYRNLQATIQGVEIGDSESLEVADTVIEPDQELWLEAESNAGLGMPVGYYALLDSAWRHRQGVDVDQHRDNVAQLYQQMSETAQGNAQAWSQNIVEAEFIRNPSAKNPMLAFPYTKLHNSSWNVDQASALIFCSIKKARALGIAEEHWIYPACSTESNLMQAVSQRADLSRCYGAFHAGNKALALANISVDEVDLVELYSCFPIAVLSFAEELNMLHRRDLTVTGGMPFAGGPLNNFVLQSTVRMLEVMQQQNKNFGMVSNVSGLNTKQAFSVFSKTPRAFVMADVTADVVADSPLKEMANGYSGEAVVQAFTVLYNKQGAERLLVIAENAKHQRCLAHSQDATLMEYALHHDLVGLTVSIDSGVFILDI